MKRMFAAVAACTAWIAFGAPEKIIFDTDMYTDFDDVTSFTASNPKVHGAEASGTVNRHVCATKFDVLAVERPITFVTPSRAIQARYGHNPLFSGV